MSKIYTVSEHMHLVKAVYLNGVYQDKVIEALEGENGYVIYYPYPFEFEGDDLKTDITYGNVEVILKEEK